ncbi:MAG: phospholipase D-like domain-containing protein, partial [Holophagales bacterium]|nr:phospholipase D-like domain-containing protein [Holophagales bacterium]
RDAHRRGVEVRILIDALGDRYTWPPMHRLLQQDGLDAVVFRPTRWPMHVAYANLRNHRKLLVVDAHTAFTGGMNIRIGHWIERSPEHPVHDLHFRLEGPIVHPLQRVFAGDWAFASGRQIDPEVFFPGPEQGGNPTAHEGDADPRNDAFDGVIARVIDDGPADRFGHMRWSFLGALACARKTIRIATPYFLPDEGLVTGLAMAARRGVEVEILLPEKNNLLLVQWASTALLWQVLEPGCRIFLVPPPFDHSKVLLVDGQWALLGSANWDARSLRLNFELDVECYSATLARRLGEILDEKRARSRELFLSEVDARPWPVRLRDGLARMLSPYL